MSTVGSDELCLPFYGCSACLGSHYSILFCYSVVFFNLLPIISKLVWETDEDPALVPVVGSSHVQIIHMEGIIFQCHVPRVKKSQNV